MRLTRERFEAPGLLLDEGSHRRLFSLIRDVAAATRQPMPADVYLINEVNAWLTHRGGFMGFRTRPILGLGLPLVQGLRVRELEAVLAHEFAHASGPRLSGRWLRRTWTAISRALLAAARGLFTTAPEGSTRSLERFTRAMAREQEFCADALAARVVSPQAMASALRRTEGLGPAFDAYWHTEVVPALNAGCVPPITSGFRQYLEVDDVSAAVRRLLRASESHGEVDAFDTHPPLRDRLAALSRMDGPAFEPAADPPAATLLPDADALARRLVAFAPGIERCARLRVVGWQDLATEVYPTRWRQAAARSSAFLARYTPGSIPAGREAFVAAGRELLGDAGADDALRFRYAVHVFSMGLGAALLDAGFTPETSPGRPVVFARSGRRLLAFDAVQDLADGRLTALEWQAKCRAAGIGELRLGARAAA